MKVNNLNNTSGNKCKCDSWLSHWEKFAHRNKVFCSVHACVKMAEVGGHVQKHTSDNAWYIIPLCHSHNLKDGELEIGDATVPLQIKVY